MVSRIILACGVPKGPNATTKDMNLHLPCGLIPVELRARFSSWYNCDLVRPEPSWPQILAGSALPEYSFLASLDTFDMLLIFLVLGVTLVNRSLMRSLGVAVDAEYVIPRSLVDLAPEYLMP